MGLGIGFAALWFGNSHEVGMGKIWLLVVENTESFVVVLLLLKLLKLVGCCGFGELLSVKLPGDMPRF